jgi:SAM-dependent methyltransferase
MSPTCGSTATRAEGRIVICPGICPVCTGPLRRGVADWHRICGSCGHETAELPVRINSPDAHDRLDEADRETALEALRRRNNRRLIGWLRELRPAVGRRLLDVGAGHGWLVEDAGADFDCLGLEPDRRVGATARRRGLPVVEGRFPGALAPSDRFDVIVFNDVFEHLADVRGMLDAVRERLAPRGVLVINAPNRRGTFYRLAALMARAGSMRAFERMWQRGLPSPHLHYFDERGLARLLRAAGFEVEKTARLPAVQWRGLIARIRYTRQAGVPATIAVAAFTAMALPLLRCLPSDSMVMFCRAAPGSEAHAG